MFLLLDDLLCSVASLIDHVHLLQVFILAIGLLIVLKIFQVVQIICHLTVEVQCLTFLHFPKEQRNPSR